jgi:hypothetical protein
VFTITEATTGLLHKPRMMDEDECGAVGGMLGKGKRSTRREPAPVQSCLPHIPLDLTRVRNLDAAVGSQRLSA